MTSAAFSCDIARSTSGSTTSPTAIDDLRVARARIFSTTVMPMCSSGTSDHFLCPQGVDVLLAVPDLAQDRIRGRAEPRRRRSERAGRLRELGREVEEPQRPDSRFLDRLD